MGQALTVLYTELLLQLLLKSNESYINIFYVDGALTFLGLMILIFAFNEQKYTPKVQKSTWTTN